MIIVRPFPVRPMTRFRKAAHDLQECAAWTVDSVFRRVIGNKTLYLVLSYVLPFIWAWAAAHSMWSGSYVAGTVESLLFAYYAGELRRDIRKRKEDVIREVHDS